MKNNKKLLSILKLTFLIIIFGLFGWVYFSGIIYPEFESPYNGIYIGIGNGMIYPLYFMIIPTFVKKQQLEVKHSEVIVPAIAFIITLMLLIFINAPKIT